MSILVVVFHDEASDQARRLTPLLRSRGLDVNSDRTHRVVECADGALFVCYDSKPTKPLIKDIVNQTRNEPNLFAILALHARTLARDFDLSQAQRALANDGQPLKGARIRVYSHIESDPFYTALCSALEDNDIKLARLAQVVEPEGNRSKSIGNRKHEICRLFLALDFDLQHWRSTGFDSNVGTELISRYSGPGTGRGLQDRLREARRLAYSGTPESHPHSIEQNVFGLQGVESEWSQLERLLPRDETGKAHDLFHRIVTIHDKLQSAEHLESLARSFQQTIPLTQWLTNLLEIIAVIERQSELQTSTAGR